MEKRLQVLRDTAIIVKPLDRSTNRHVFVIDQGSDVVYLNTEETVEIVRKVKQLYFELTGEVMEA